MSSYKRPSLPLVFRYLIVLGLVGLLVGMSTVPVFAIANPDTIEVESIRVFQNIWDSGDMLFVVEYEVGYAVDPTEDPELTFMVSLYDGATLKATRPLSYYGYVLTSLYLTESEATALSITWGGNYTIRVMGNPTYFALVEGTNMRSSALSSGSWVSGSQANSRTYLATWLDGPVGARGGGLVGTIENETGLTLTTSSGLLNATGSIIFLAAIPGLSNVVPEIFYTSVSYPEAPDYTHTQEYAGNLTSGLVGTRLGVALNNLGDFIGISGTLMGGFGLMVLFFILAGRIFVATGSSSSAIVLALPFVLIGNLMGIIPLGITFVAGTLVILMFGITFLLGRLA